MQLKEKTIKNLTYISPRDMRKNRTDAVHIMMLCDAFSDLGVKVNLVTPKVYRHEYKVEFNKIFDLYDLEERFQITELDTNIKENQKNRRDALSVIMNKFYYYSLFFWKHRKDFRKSESVVYSKCFISSVPYILLKKMGVVSSKFFFEAASIKKGSLLHKFVCKNADGIVAGLKYTVNDIIKHSGVTPDKFAETPLVFLENGAKKKEVPSKDICRKNLGFQPNKKYILYAGKTGIRKKSVQYFIECAKTLNQFEFVIVGANKSTFKYYTELKEKQSITNLQIYPFMPLRSYFSYLKAADLLVDYYEDTYYNRFFLGPGKSSSYLMSENPVLFPDLPSLRHLFPEDIIFFIEPDNVPKFSEKIISIFSNEKEISQRVERSLAYAQKHSFKNTGRKILKFLESK